jgi:prepilin-type processing-associated H-X9-DG protein
MLMLGDGISGWNGVFKDGDGKLWRSPAGQDMDYYDKRITKRVELRHQGRANVAFCDGHVEAPTLEYLFSNNTDAALKQWNRDNQPHRERLPK